MGSLEDMGCSTTTIQTYLSHLVKKGALSTKRQGKGFLYMPAVTEQECQLSESKSFLNRVFDGSMSSMVMSFIKSGNLTNEEFAQLKKIVERHGELKNDSR